MSPLVAFAAGTACGWCWHRHWCSRWQRDPAAALARWAAEAPRCVP